MKLSHLASAVFLLAIPCSLSPARAEIEEETARGTSALEREWDVETGRGITAQPAVAGARLLALTTDGWAVLVDCDAGEIVWKGRSAYGFSLPPLVADSVAFVVSEGAKRYLACLSLGTGERKWKRDVGRLRAGPLAVPDGVLLLEEGDSLKILAGPGSRPGRGWSRALRGPCLPEIHVMDGNLFVACGDSIFFFDSRSGALLGRVEVGPVSTFCPLEDEKGILLVRRSGEIVLFGPEFGETIWSARVSSSPRHYLTVETSRIVASAGERLSCYEAEGGDLLWEASFSAPIAGAPCALSGFLALVTVEGRLHLLAADTGEVLAEARVGEPVQTSPVSCAGKLVIATLKGKLVSFTAGNAGGGP